MFGSAVWSRLVVVGVLAVIATPALAQKGGGKGGGKGAGGVKVGANGLSTQQIQQQIQNIVKQIQQGEKPLKEANDRMGEERRTFQKAELDHKTNVRDLNQAKKQAEEEGKHSPELKAAQKKMSELQDQVAAARKKVIESLIQDKEEYRSAVKAHQAAVDEQKSQSGPDVPVETRRNHAKKVSDLDLRRKTIEDVALANTSEGKELSAKLKEATAEVAAASKKKHDQIENDPKIASAKIGFQRTRDELKRAKTSLEQAEGEYGRVQSQLRSLDNQRANLQSQQQLLEKMQNTKGNKNAKR